MSPSDTRAIAAALEEVAAAAGQRFRDAEKTIEKLQDQVIYLQRDVDALKRESRMSLRQKLLSKGVR